MSKSTNSRVWLQALLLLMACLAVYLNSLANELVWDDTVLIPQNNYIKQIKNIPLFFSPEYWNRMHPASGQRQYRPMRTLTLAVDYFFWKENPFGYHLTNLILHMINVMLVFLLSTMLVHRLSGPPIPGDTVAGPLPADTMRYLPLLTALFFAVHPVHTESVTFVKNRSELLASMFCLAALPFFIWYCTLTGGWARRLFATGCLACFAAALLSKETALVLPGLMFLYMICFVPTGKRPSALAVIFICGSLIPAWFWFRQSCLVGTAPAAGMVDLPVWRHLLVIIKTVGIYLGLLAFPVHLNAERLLDMPESLFAPDVLFSLAALSGIGVFMIRDRRSSPWLIFAVGWTFLTLIPAANIVFLKTRPLAEQRLYLPSLGFCLALAWLFAWLSVSAFSRAGRKGRTAVFSAGLLLVTVYGTGTINRNRDWRDPVTLFSKTAAASPESARIQYNLGVALVEKGRLASAIPCFKKAVALQPSHGQAHFNLAVALVKIDRKAEATRHFELAVACNPDDVVARIELSVALADEGRTAAADREFAAAGQLEPDKARLYYLSGIAWKNRQVYDRAVGCFNRSLEIDPEQDGIYSYLVKTLNHLGLARLDAGDFGGAIEHLRRAAKINRTIPDTDTLETAEIYNNLGVALKNAGDFDGAVASHRKALLIRINRLGPDHPDTAKSYYNLGQSWAGKGDMEQAATCYRKAFSIFRDRLGADHRFTLTVENILAALTEKNR